MEQKKLGCFVTAKVSPTFGSFGSALIGALMRSVCDNLCSAFKDTFSLTVLYGNCLAEWLLPHRPETAPPRSVTTTVIASIIILALIVAAVAAAPLNGVCSRDLHISAAPQALGTDGSIAALTLPRYADGASGGPFQCFTITRSWLHRTRNSARRPGRGTVGSSSVVDPEAAAPVKCGTFHPPCTNAAPPLQQRSLSLQHCDWPRPGRRSWPCCRARLRLSPA